MRPWGGRPSVPTLLRPRSSIDTRRMLILAALVVAGLWFWSAPWLAPLRLLVVLVHETGHALATLLFGGRVERILVGADESGQCLSSVPAGWLPQIAVYSAGYVGSAVSGALQLILAFRFRLHRAVLFTGLYALFDLRDDLWRSGGGQSDAVLLAMQTHVPAIVWSLLWSAVSVAVLALAAVVSLRRPRPIPLDGLEAVRSAAASGMRRTTPDP